MPSVLSSHAGVVATTTAWGPGDLEEVLERIADETDARIVELSIGARPCDDPVGVLDQYRDRFEYLAHHSAPILPQDHLRPIRTHRHHAVAWLQRLGITRYTVHPPNRRLLADEQGFWAWAWDWYELLGSGGIEMRVETMYRPRDRSEMEISGGYPLSTAAEVLRFAEAAHARGWEVPLLIDLSHLHIGYCGGGWAESDIIELLSAGLSDHLHVSANDGRRDLHTVLPGGHLVESWARDYLDAFDYVVDEGKRGRRPSPTR